MQTWKESLTRLKCQTLRIVKIKRNRVSQWESNTRSLKNNVIYFMVDHTVIDQFDHVFLFGDTNYRINAERPFVFDALKRGDYNVMSTIGKMYDITGTHI